MSLTAKFTAAATSLISSLGYGGLAVGLVVDSAGVPIPSEVMLPLAGALVRQGRFNFAAALLVATLAQTLGASLAYLIGASGGLAAAKRWGKYVFFSERELATTHRWFERYGYWLAFFGRCLPVIRTYVGYPAGIARMPFTPFIMASAAGSAVWSFVLLGAGYLLADRLSQIDRVTGGLTWIILALLGLGLIWYFIRHRAKNR